MLGVTIFGIFLTPVFFYVIEGLSESEFFTRPGVRRTGSVIASSLLGALVGSLLGALGVVRIGWATLAGGTIGAVVMIGLLQLQWWRERESRMPQPRA
jgi:multidrug efflux pump